MCIRFSPACDLYIFPLRRGGSLLICRPARYKDNKDDGFRMALSCRKKTVKAMIPMVIASVTKNPLRKKCQNPMHSTASFLFSVRFVSDAALLRSLLCLVCRSSDSSIQAARLIAACDLAPYCQRIASAFSPGHDSPSNDRFSPHAGISRMENNTLESQLLSESCRALAISNVQTADPAMDSFRVRDLHPIPLFSEQACVSDLPRRAGSKLSP